MLTILWDNDGVLVDTEGLYFRATQEVLRTVGVPLCRRLQEAGSVSLNGLTDTQRSWLTGAFAKVCCRVDMLRFIAMALNLAALVCTDDCYLKAETLWLSNIKGCIPVDTAAYGIPSKVKNAGRLRSSMNTSPFGDNEADQKQLSPVTHVAKDKGIPPFLILHWQSQRLRCHVRPRTARP